MPPQSPASGFRWLAWPNLAAQCGEQIAVAAAAIFTVVALGGDVVESGVIQTLHTLPFLVFAIPAGLLVDRLPRKMLLASAEALRAISLAAICLLAWFGALSWPLLALLGLIGACGTVAFSVAAPALVPSLVAHSVLARANARIELARTIAFTAGPTLGGVLVGWYGPIPAFGFATALSLGAASLLLLLEEPPRAPAARRRVLEEILEGTRFVVSHELLRPVLATQFLFNVAFFALLAAFVPHAVHALGLSAAAVGVVLGAYGAGMIAGALAAPHLMRVLPFGNVVAIGPLSGLLGALAIASTLWLPSALLAAAGFVLLGVGPLIWVVSTTTLRQLATPPDLLGRVSAINVLAYGARPIGAGLGAAIGAAFGVEACLVAAAAGFAAQAGLILASPVVRLGDVATAAAKRLRR